MQQELLTPKEFCKINGLSVSCLYKYMKTGKGPETLKIGGMRRISVEAMRAWQERFADRREPANAR